LTGTATATLSGKVYIVGGYNFGGSTRDVQVLEPRLRHDQSRSGDVRWPAQCRRRCSRRQTFVMGGTLPTGAVSSSAEVSVLTT
jgi:hypothetical protein